MGEPPPGETLHPDLRRDYRRSLRGSLLTFALAGALIVGVFALRPLATRQELVRSAIYTLPGWIMLLGAALSVRIAFWYRRCSSVYYGRQPSPMRVHALHSRQGTMILELHRLSDTRMRETQHRIWVQAPSWDASSIEGQIVKVRLDEDPEGPVVVEAEGGVLWPVPLARRQNRPEFGSTA